MKVDVKLAIGMTIALSPGLACFFGCGKEYDFEVSEQAFDLDTLRSVNRWAESDAERCDHLCQYASWEYVAEVHECLLELEPGVDLATRTSDTAAPDTGLAPGTTLAGHVSCAGIAEKVCRGRLPFGAALEQVETTDLAGTLARFAAEERAAVVAFEQIASRLASWGAPADLVARCLHAASQERKHDALMSWEAHERGAPIPTVALSESEATLLEMALNNASQGCANESAAALVAAVLARTAPTKTLRAAFATIAVEEAQHAELSFDLHAWFLDQLSPAERSILGQALSDALDRIPALVANEARTLPPELPLGPVEAATRAGRALRAQLA